MTSESMKIFGCLRGTGGAVFWETFFLRQPYHFRRQCSLHVSCQLWIYSELWRIGMRLVTPRRPLPTDQAPLLIGATFVGPTYTIISFFYSIHRLNGVPHFSYINYWSPQIQIFQFPSPSHLLENGVYKFLKNMKIYTFVECHIYIFKPMWHTFWFYFLDLYDSK